MKEKTKEQKGFIQIPLLLIIIASVIATSAGAGIILHKQGKLTPLVAAISEVFKGTGETAITEEIKPEEPQIEQPEINQEEVTQQELEQTRLDAEKTKTEAEKFKTEVENLKKEIESLKQTTNEKKKETVGPFIGEIIPSQIFNNLTSVVVIKGSNFKNWARVFIGDNELKEVKVIDDKMITAKIPPGLIATTYNITVINPDGESSTLNNVIVVVNVVTSTPPAELTTSEITEKVSPAVVQINTESSLGSGMIVDSTGYILTNEHVISGESVVSVKLKDGRVFSGSVIGWNKSKDLAIIKIDCINLIYVVLGDSDKVKTGDKIVVLGHPLGLLGVVISEGIITAVQGEGNESLLQTNASTQPGSSGGPWVNNMGEVVGIHVAGIGPVLFGYKLDIGGYNFAIPINTAKSILSDLKAGTQK